MSTPLHHPHLSLVPPYHEVLRLAPTEETRQVWRLLTTTAIKAALTRLFYRPRPIKNTCLPRSNLTLTAKTSRVNRGALETRGWKTRVKTPGGQYSFEALSAALKKEAKEAAEKAKNGGFTSEWAKKAAAAASGAQPRNSDGGKDQGRLSLVRSPLVRSFALSLVLSLVHLSFHWSFHWSIGPFIGPFIGPLVHFKDFPSRGAYD